MRFTTIKPVVASIAALALTVPMAACGSSSASSDGPVTLQFFANNTQDVYKPIIKAFEKKYPKIHIQFSTTSGAQAGYQQTLQTRISGGRLPDVFIAPPEQLPDLVKSHSVKDLTNEPFMSRIGDTNKKQATINGKVWSMSVTSWINAYAYNKDLLAKAGYTSIPSTWDGFLTMLKKLKAAGVKEPYLEAKGGLGAPIEAWEGYYTSQHNGVSPDKLIDQKKSTFVKSMTKYYEQWDRLVKDGVMSKSVTGLADDQVRSEFAAGRLAVMPSGYWDVNTFNQAKINYGFGRYPMLNKGDTPWTRGSADSGYAISAKLSGAKLKAAEKFLDFMSTPEGLKLTQKNLGLIPATKNYSAKLDPKFQDVYDTYIKTGHFYMFDLDWNISGRSAMGAEVYSQLAQVVLGQQTCKQAAANLDQKYNSLRS